jgi:hypothetical protein
MPTPGAEDHDAALLQVPDRPARDVGLGDLAHRDGGLHRVSMWCSRSRKSCSTRQFMTVPSMPM